MTFSPSLYFLVPAAPVPTDHQLEVIRLIEKYGTCNNNVYTAFSNPEMEVFLVPGMGCLLYTVAKYWSRTVVTATGDPLCDQKDVHQMLLQFKRHYPRAIFIDLSKPVAQLLQDDGGMTINDMGPETVINVQQFHFEFNKVCCCGAPHGFCK